MQGSSSISSSSVDAMMPRYHCGVRSSIRTAWKCDYPGRRFYGCSGYRTSRRCSFFQCVCMKRRQSLRLPLQQI
ncbi:hypothetical protein Ahy_B05g076939 [Arachis hypogaea]|uniref:Zinc finger GRF-type domain-containing protein n=1 Tax=Arachis hypogaea TaxID=3818 RepID=A0A444Z4F8_ARAHY|nr:hypothetical protein Ahy_B05g076939 [Arachis hypogaea]